MNLSETLRGLLRRWYIVIPGLVLAVAVAISAWIIVKPGYERTATQLLLPGAESMPANANPFLFLGGLSNAADVLVRAVGAENVLGEVAAKYPKAEVEVTRDGSTPGPVILIKATASSDDEAAAVLAMMVDRTASILEDIQVGENIEAVNRITVVPVTIDEVSTLQQRNRIIASAGVGLITIILTILGASLFDGLSLDKRRRGRGQPSKDGRPEEEEGDEGVGSDDALPSDQAGEPESTAESTAGAGADADADADANDDINSLLFADGVQSHDDAPESKKEAKLKTTTTRRQR